MQQVGFVHFQFAGFDLGQTKVHEQEFDSAHESILAKGAVWGPGPRKRATEPVFVQKRVAPKQLLSRCAATAKSSRLAKLVGRLQELFTRLSRQVGTEQDCFQTKRTAIKAFWNLRDLSAPVGWTNPAFPSLTEVFLSLRWAEQTLSSIDAQIRLKRIKSWKQRIRDSVSSGCTYIFQHLKNIQQDEPPNLVVNDTGDVIYQPDEALSFLNNAWDDVFGVNTLCEHPLKMLEVVWPYIADKHQEVSLPAITGHDLHISSPCPSKEKGPRGSWSRWVEDS